ncbi:MAG: radical SAM protein, partial [Candidatus Thorarchaeota archaeon]|nr:radical SAM protein [Candidatus Thorarchaeota archaeon]
RRVLEKLIGTTAKLQILTKSSLVERDIDLFKQFENIQVGISLNSLDEKFTRIIEPRASKPQDRLSALKKVAAAGISTYVFISPIFPKISDWEAIIEAALPITNEFRFENLNFRGHNIPRIMKLISENSPELLDYYKEIRKEPSLWNQMEEDIEDFCKARHLRCRVEFHHGGFTKTKQN